MIITKDVTEREEVYRNTKKEAKTDGLTGLYNRNYLNQILEDIQEEQKSFSAFMIDINGLKYINDNFGHNAGDETIKKAAQIIMESVRTTDYVFRYGGDEFLVLLDTDNLGTLEAISKRIKSRNSRLIKGAPVLNLSIGYASSLETSLDEVIDLADKRMYEDKQLFYQNEGKFIKRLEDN
ncbi:MAG: GGDEF domain-containing protein [Peptococcales bacterium]|jgi:diguanylate cyclase (GGDEF)-like protein